MDWKYKHFHQTRLFPGDCDLVWEAARTFMSQSLGWKITGETSEGITAEGYSFAHRAIANIRIQPAVSGTTLDIELLVERAGSTGFMLFDVGGYYNIQIRKWLDGIQLLLHQKLAGGEAASVVPLPPPPNKVSGCLFNGCLAFIVVTFGFWFLATLISAVVGLFTGTLYLWGRGGTVIHGIPARIVSALILAFAVFVVWRIKRKR